MTGREEERAALNSSRQSSRACSITLCQLMMQITAGFFSFICRASAAQLQPAACQILQHASILICVTFRSMRRGQFSPNSCHAWRVCVMTRGTFWHFCRGKKAPKCAGCSNNNLKCSVYMWRAREGHPRGKKRSSESVPMQFYVFLHVCAPWRALFTCFSLFLKLPFCAAGHVFPPARHHIT